MTIRVSVPAAHQQLMVTVEHRRDEVSWAVDDVRLPFPTCMMMYLSHSLSSHRHRGITAAITAVDRETACGDLVMWYTDCTNCFVQCLPQVDELSRRKYFIQCYKRKIWLCTHCHLNIPRNSRTPVVWKMSAALCVAAEWVLTYVRDCWSAGALVARAPDRSLVRISCGASLPGKRKRWSTFYNNNRLLLQ